MPRTKRTIVRDSVFGQSDTPRVTQGTAVPADDEKTRQTGVWLTDQDLEWLDSRCREVRRGGWRGITRSAFIRALVQAVENKPFEDQLVGVTGQAELVQAIQRALK
jgi:hypothetical protein